MHLCIYFHLSQHHPPIKCIFFPHAPDLSILLLSFSRQNEWKRLLMRASVARLLSAKFRRKQFSPLEAISWEERQITTSGQLKRLALCMQRNSMDYFLSFQWRKSTPDGGHVPSKLGKNLTVNIAIKVVNKTVLFVCVLIWALCSSFTHIVYLLCV